MLPEPRGDAPEFIFGEVEIAARNCFGELRQARNQVAQQLLQLRPHPVRARMREAGNIGEADARHKIEDDPLLLGMRRVRRRLGERRQVVRDGRKLEADAARVRLVHHQQIEDERQDGREQIALPEGDDAVRDVEHEEQTGRFLLVGRGLAEQREQKLGKIEGALDAPAHILEPPAVVPRHVLRGEPVQRCDCDDAGTQPVEQLHRIGSLVGVFRDDIGEAQQRSPDFEREALAHDAAGAQHAALEARQTVGPPRRGHQEPHSLLDRGRIGAQTLYRTGGLILRQDKLKRFRAAIAGAGASAIVRGGERAPHKPHDPIGALAIAAKPVKIVGDAAAQDGSGAQSLGDLAGGAHQREMRNRRQLLGADPYIAGMPVRRRHRHAGRTVDRHGKPAGHDPVLAIHGPDIEAHGELPGLQPIGGPGRSGCAILPLLGDEGRPVQLQIELQRIQLASREPFRQHALLRTARPPAALVGRADHEAIRMLENELARVQVAQPAPGAYPPG